LDQPDFAAGGTSQRWTDETIFPTRLPAPPRGSRVVHHVPGRPGARPACVLPGGRRRGRAGRRRRAGPLATGLCLLALAGCDLAPIYSPPRFILPASYQGSAPFKVAQPGDAMARGAWWRLFGDPLLDGLEEQLAAVNPDLQAAEEQYTQSRDLAAEARAGLFPQFGLGATTSDNQQSLHRLFRSNIHTPNVESSNQIDATASWVPDFWQAISNETRIQKRLAQGSAASLATARLSLESELAIDYIALRGLDVQDYVLRQAIRYYTVAVDITTLREAGKIASGLDVARAKGQLASGEVQESDVLASRALLQHAIAVLVGAQPSAFAIPPDPGPRIAVPSVPAGVPSELLQRRPDIATSERSMAAANAAIGVTRAAFYPNVTLSAIAGFEDSGFSLTSLPNALWSIGARGVLPLFEGGLRRAELQRSWAQYAQTRDLYRATVLRAFQEVEDGLSLTRQLAVETRQGREAVRQALVAQKMSLILYQGGLDNYLNVLFSQVTALTAQITEILIEVRQRQAVVGLIAALGGGWTTADLPTGDEVLPFNPLSATGNRRAPAPTPGVDTPDVGPLRSRVDRTPPT
jgi:multidrug efflux system outer membrane protein